MHLIPRIFPDISKGTIGPLQEACVRTQDYHSGLARPRPNKSQAVETTSVGGLVPWWINQQSAMVYSLAFDSRRGYRG